MLSENERSLVILGIIWHVIALIEIVVVIVFSNLEIVVSATRELPVLSLDIDILFQWYYAYLEIAEHIGMFTLIIVFAICFLLWAFAIYLIKNALEYGSDIQFSVWNVNFYTPFIVGFISLSMVLFVFICSPITSLVFAFLIVSAFLFTLRG